MHTIHHDTKAWKLQVWVSFAAASTLCGIGLEAALAEARGPRAEPQ